jgi:hypothetical protein
MQRLALMIIAASLALAGFGFASTFSAEPTAIACGGSKPKPDDRDVDKPADPKKPGKPKPNKPKPPVV